MRSSTAPPVYAPQEFSGFDTLSVVTFDLTEGVAVEQVVTVMSGGDTATHPPTASTWRAIAGSTGTTLTKRMVEGITTHIHRFDISGAGGAVYEASGSIDGFLLNQFAMSEHDGYLRVASTDMPTWWWRTDGTSRTAWTCWNGTAGATRCGVGGRSR